MINFNNPDFDGILEKAGFERLEENTPVFFNGGITIDLSKGMNTVNLRKIIDAAFSAGELARAKAFNDLLEH